MNLRAASLLISHLNCNSTPFGLHVVPKLLTQVSEMQTELRKQLEVLRNQQPTPQPAAADESSIMPPVAAPETIRTTAAALAPKGLQEASEAIHSAEAATAATGQADTEMQASTDFLIFLLFLMSSGGAGSHRGFRS